MFPLPLDGTRVIDLTISWAGPKVTQCWADLGAEVIKVESIQWVDAQRGRKKVPPGMPQYPDRQPGQRPWDRCASFNQLNRNKLSITLDLGSSRGRELFLRLVQLGDVVVDCFTARVMDKFNLGYETLRQTKPDIIVMSMPGYGKVGPYRDYLSWGSMVECFAGQAAARGYPGGEPFMCMAYADPIAGFTGAFALLAALYHRQQTGEGQFIDFSQVDAFTPLSAEAILDYTMNQRLPEPRGNRHPFMAPHGAYPCAGKDRWITIAVATDGQWGALCRATGHPEWATDPRFADAQGRWRHQEELDALLSGWTRERDWYEAMHTLQAAGIAAGPALDFTGLFADPHLQARGFFQNVTHPEAGTHPYPARFWQMEQTDTGIRLPAPCLGQHNHEVLEGLMGLGSQEVARLETDQIIGTEPLDSAVS